MKRQSLIAGLAVVGASLAGVSSASAWGPERATFTMGSPATYPVFNSITDNPTIGDERDFVRVGEINAQVTDLKNEIEVVPGRQYLVYVYFHNDASSTYNDAEHNRAGIAFKTRMASAFPAVLVKGEKGKVSATITAENSNPGSVWDEAYFTTNSDKVLLKYVAGSAKIYNDWGANGSVLSENLFSEDGTWLGLNELNGVILGCEEYHGTVSYVLQAEALSGSVEKTVSLDGNDYKETVSAHSGDIVYYKLVIKNTGDIALNNVTIKDSLPSGVNLVAGSVRLTANNSANPDTLSDNLVGTGYNIGTVGTGNTVTITYRATVSGEFDCNGTTLTNTAKLTYDSNTKTGDSVEDTASVVGVKENCDTPKPNCTTNPDLPECKIPSTGPAEIAMAVAVVLGLGGGSFYLYRTRRALKKVTDSAKGVSEIKPEDMPKNPEQQ